MQCEAKRARCQIILHSIGQGAGVQIICNIVLKEILSLERKPTAIQSTPTEYQLPQGIMYLPWKI